ncbi:MAG: hypothetical protein RPR40_00560 [Bermanella sp.]
MINNISNDVLACKNISVILRNRENGRPYVESYRLTNLVYCEGRFWGKCANVHSPLGHDKMSASDSLSYAYNNFSPVVCTLSLNTRMQRYISANAYSDISFVASGQHSMVWSSDDESSVSLLLKTVLSGLKTKVVIEVSDGYVYILPVHTIIFYEENKCFELETEFDGFPERLRDFNSFDAMADQFKSFLKANPSISHVNSSYDFNSKFFLTNFLLRNNEVIHRSISDEGNVVSENIEYKSVKIWCES